MKILLICISTLSLWSLNSKAEITYTTSKGAVFIQIQDPNFGTAWKDPSGKIWSSFQGNFDNLPIEPDQNHEVVKSAATEACKKISGELPAYSDYRRLNSYFESFGWDGGYSPLTPQGKKDLHSIFSDMAPERGYWRQFWTRSLYYYVKVDDSAYNISGKYLEHYATTGRGAKLSVRCVRN